MSNDANTVVRKLWNFCDILRDDGVSYGDYVGQLTYLLFLKMADEQTKPPFNKESKIPAKYNWGTLTELSGSDLEKQYKNVLENLAKESGLLGVIFRKSQNMIQDPAKLNRLVTLIDGNSNDKNRILWSGMDIDTKGDIYEGLLEKNAKDVKGGAGQYFTPRALIAAIMDVIKPQPGETVGDPACGTGGFFLAAHKYIIDNFTLDPDQKKFLKTKTFKGWDIVTEVIRLCAMNMYLQGIGDKASQVNVADSLIKDTGDKFDIITTNPPFGKKSSTEIIGKDGKKSRSSTPYDRDDFWTTTSNKQLNFLQHVKSIIKTTGRCAIVVPDNVLFEGGAGETVRIKMLEQFDCHTLLRLPTGIFYAGGVKANVLFFDGKPARTDGKAWTQKMWIYDFRTNKHFTLKENTLDRKDLDDFVRCYNAKKRKETDRFHCYSYEDLIKGDKTSWDIFWLKDNSLEDLDNLPEPQDIADDMKGNLESALGSVNLLVVSLI